MLYISQRLPANHQPSYLYNTSMSAICGRSCLLVLRLKKPPHSTISRQSSTLPACTTPCLMSVICACAWSKLRVSLANQKGFPSLLRSVACVIVSQANSEEKTIKTLLAKEKKIVYSNKTLFQWLQFRYRSLDMMRWNRGKRSKTFKKGHKLSVLQ